MLHTFEHFIFCFVAAVLKPANYQTAAKPEQHFKQKENNSAEAGIQVHKTLMVVQKLDDFNDGEENQAFPQHAKIEQVLPTGHLSSPFPSLDKAALLCV